MRFMCIGWPARTARASITGSLLHLNSSKCLSYSLFTLHLTGQQDLSKETLPNKRQPSKFQITQSVDALHLYLLQTTFVSNLLVSQDSLQKEKENRPQAVETSVNQESPNKQDTIFASGQNRPINMHVIANGQRKPPFELLAKDMQSQCVSLNGLYT